MTDTPQAAVTPSKVSVIFSCIMWFFTHIRWDTLAADVDKLKSK